MTETTRLNFLVYDSAKSNRKFWDWFSIALKKLTFKRFLNNFNIEVSCSEVICIRCIAVLCECIDYLGQLEDRKINKQEYRFLALIGLLLRSLDTKISHRYGSVLRNACGLNKRTIVGKALSCQYNELRLGHSVDMKQRTAKHYRHRSIQNHCKDEALCKEEVDYVILSGFSSRIDYTKVLKIDIFFC